MTGYLAVYAPGPHSYTGEDTVELQCHGSPAVLTEALSALFQARGPASGARGISRACIFGTVKSISPPQKPSST